MVDIRENELINTKLSKVYKEFTSDFLEMWEKAYKSKAPTRINEFGIINVKKYDTDNRVLFIGRETNGWSDADFAKGCLFREWMKEITETGLAGKGHIKRHPNMWYNVGRWALLLDNPDIDIKEIAYVKEEAIRAIGNIAFTNMNKVRGDNKIGKKYNKLMDAPIVGEVLKREIEIIKPEIVICCGTCRPFHYHIKDFEGKVIYMPHPGARIKSEEMLLELKNQYIHM